MSVLPRALPSNFFRARLRAAAFAVALATALGIGSAARMLVLYRQGGRELALVDALSSGLIDWYLWLPCAPIIVACARRWPVARAHLATRLALHVLLSIAISAAQLSAFAAASSALRGDALTSGLHSAFLIKFHAGVFVYWTVLLAVQAWSAARRAREESLQRAQLGEQLAESRLSALHAHLRPHFLFNTLNSIAALTRRDPERAEQMIAQLGALLRRTIDDRDVQEVALDEELRFLADYLAIEQARFGARLAVRIDVEPAARRACVPPLLLQPLVENAIHHGIAPRVEGGCVTVRASTADGCVRIHVTDDGTWTEASVNGAGLGLASARERLRLLYGDRGRCDVRAGTPDGTEVTVELPLPDEPARGARRAMSIRTLIVDDEPLARGRLRDVLEATPGFSVAGECADGRAAAEALVRGACDLVLLDVQMPGLDGFGVLAEVGPEHMPPVVFVTAYDEYAVRAFEVCALDYVEKPWDRERLELALVRARDEIERRHDGALARRLGVLLATRADPAALAGKLIVRAGARSVFLELAEVDWIEGAANYARVHCGADEYLARETLKSLAGRLPEGRFTRVHRSTIVNTSRLRALEPDADGELVAVLRDGTRLRCGRTYREQLLRILAGQ